MVRKEYDWTDGRVEKIVGRILQIGVIAAASVVLIGGPYLYLGRYGSVSPHYDVFSWRARKLAECLRGYEKCPLISRSGSHSVRGFCC